MIYYLGAFGLIFIGLFIILVKSNLIKVIIGLSILDTGVNLFLISVVILLKGPRLFFQNLGWNPFVWLIPCRRHWC